MSYEQVRGTTLRGDEPKRLELSDGSRLLLDGSASQDRVGWRRIGRRDGSVHHQGISVADAKSLAGDDYAGYIATRTRAEAEWLRAVGDWYRDEANRLQRELAEAPA